MSQVGKHWAPLLAAGLIVAVWILLSLLAPVDGCYSEEQGVPESLTIGVIAVAALASGYLGWSRRHSGWAIVGYALAGAVAAISIYFLLMLTWTVANGCPISER